MVTNAQPVAVGVDDHRGWANLVSVVLDGGRAVVVDRRRVALIGPDLPNQPHHHEAQDLAIDTARALIGHVTASIAESTRAGLRQTVQDLGQRGYRVVSIAVRSPPSTSDDLRAVLDNQNAAVAADGALYLNALAESALELGVGVHNYAQSRVEVNAANVLGVEPAEAREHVMALRNELGPPWRQEHRLAAMAAIAALGS